MSRPLPPLPPLPHSRRLGLLVAALASALLVTLLAPPASATPPGIPSASVARTELNALRVTTEGPMTGYSRDLFPHWTSSGGCTTRQTVLQRDGSNVVVDSNCQPSSGSWYSPFDGVTVTAASGIDIDHVVPLAEAWRSGANSWTTDRRRSFANDLSRPQLIAVTASSNRSKGDQDPADWQPVSGYRCTYSRMWIRSKHHWNLSVDSAEKSALHSMLNTC